jgi:hypothetical protein
MQKKIIFTLIFISIAFVGRAEEIKFLTENSPYYIKEDLVIEEGQTFTVEPGVVIEAGRGVSIVVKGKIDISGYPQGGEVIFKAVGPSQNYNKGFWQGIVTESKEDNFIQYAVIQHSYTGIEVAKGAFLELNGNIITQNKIGIKANAAGVLSVRQNSFLNNFTDIELRNSQGKINDNFFQGSLIGIQLSRAYPEIKNNYFKQFHMYAVKTDNSKDQDLGGNFWGYTDKEKIQAIILEQGKGKVIFEPFLEKRPGQDTEDCGLCE